MRSCVDFNSRQDQGRLNQYGRMCCARYFLPP
jgi:hypothetical protein